ncbi:PEP-CTERM sorting domain-containing protein [Undibacterium sp. TJN25]|uniref:PEP-CTERM sorting domain-containing protein n=1 Tax=Undibacterium sp. TJN25 TaxID=3413056 RepID=UPI003BF19B1F
MIKTTLRTLTAIALAASTLTAFAAPITPTYTTFANLPAATYGGSGIPTDPSAITVVEARTGTLTLGLAATQRGVGPNLGNNSAGTYLANPGVSSGNASTWNFDYYVNVSAGSLSDFTYKLFYDFNPGVDTDASLLGAWNLTGSGTTLQDSQNLGFSFLTTGFPGVITPPAGTFNPNANGEYSFALVAYNLAGREVGRSAINVDVGTIPEPASLSLIGLGLLGLASRRKSAKSKQA